MRRITPHTIILSQLRVTLRPLTEADWGVLHTWNNDPLILYYSEGDAVDSMTAADMQAIYRAVAQTGYCFVIEYDGIPIGDCWLQPMNLPRILDRFPQYDYRRIDLTIGRPDLWGRGIGTTTIRLLTAFAFDHEHADGVFGCEIADYNMRSRRAFAKAGYTEINRVPQAGNKAAVRYDLYLLRTHDLADEDAQARMHPDLNHQGGRRGNTPD